MIQLTTKLSILAIFTTIIAGAQNTPSVSRAGQRPNWPPASGTAYFSLTPPVGYQPESLADLEKRSSLIADAVVDTIQPGRVLNRMLETDVVLMPRQVLKGPTTIERIVVTQRGGTLGAFKQLPAQYSLMQKGERYIVFATEDKRTNMPLVSDSRGAMLPRYWMTGEWVGAVHADGGIIHFNSSVPKALRDQYENVGLLQFMSQMMSLIKTP